MGRRKWIPDENSPNSAGMVLTVSLFLILLVFFILLNSIAVKDEKRKLAAFGSLVGAFGNLPGGLSPLRTGESIMPPSAPMVDQKFDVNKLVSLPEMPLKGQVRAESDGDRTVITINEEVLFEKGRFGLKASSYPLLNDLVGLIKKGNFSVEITGHTDGRPAHEKGHNSNWEISMLMAMKVLKYFVERGEIPPQRLAAFGYGSERSIAPNDTVQTRALNRRVEISLNYNAPAYVKRMYAKKPPGIFSYRRFDFKVF